MKSIFTGKPTDMLYDIGSMQHRARMLQDKGKDYDQLLKHINTLDFYYNEAVPKPTIKQLQEQTGIDYSKVRKHIREIYLDLIVGKDDDDFPPFSFGDVTYTISLQSMWNKRSLYFEVDSLPVIPRIGEEIEIPYFHAYLGERTFYVESIDHTLNDKGQSIHINLVPGYFNIYWHYRKAKAMEEQELNWNDFIDLNDYQLRDKLRVGR
jgi:hypothetical protein